MNVLPFTRPASGPVAMTGRVVLGMAHLSPFGLSEQWLLRDCGDRHWSLIARALGQDSAVFADGAGRPVYAAFCATSLQLDPARPAPGPGAAIEITATLHAVSGARIGSVQRIALGGQEIGRMRMISAFVSHDDTGSNRRILRNTAMPGTGLPAAPPSLAALDGRARRVARRLREARPGPDALLRATPVPALDFNAVGLLYFPTFSRLIETARPSLRPLAWREVVYCGNVDAGETLSVHDAGGGLDVARGDGRVIAHAVSAWQD